MSVSVTGPCYPPPPPLPPPRGIVSSHPTLTSHRMSFDSIDGNLPFNGLWTYDHYFESRFHFTPLEYLPNPDRWFPPSIHSKSSKPQLNLR